MEEGGGEQGKLQAGASSSTYLFLSVCMSDFG